MKFSITRKGLPLASFESGGLSIEHGICLLFQTRSSRTANCLLVLFYLSATSTGFSKDRWETRDSRELETSEKPRRGWWERAWTASREWWEGKWERGLFLRFPSLRSSKLSLIINSVIPQKSDREPLGKRQFILKKSALYGVKWMTEERQILISCHGILTDHFILLTILARIENICQVPQTSEQSQKPWNGIFDFSVIFGSPW